MAGIKYYACAICECGVKLNILEKGSKGEWLTVQCGACGLYYDKETYLLSGGVEKYI